MPLAAANNKGKSFCPCLATNCRIGASPDIAPKMPSATFCCLVIGRVDEDALFDAFVVDPTEEEEEVGSNGMCGAVLCVSKTTEGDALARVTMRAIAALRSTDGLKRYVNNVGGE